MHVVIAGQIRHAVCYKYLLQRVARAQLDGVVLSTTLVHWKADEEIALGLMSAHPGLFELIALEEPKPIAPGHFFHQAISVHEGLAARAPDDIALRLRPDTFGQSGFLEAIAKVLQASAKPLWTPYADLTCPFFANDIVFGGRVEALRAQTNFSMEPYLTPILRGEAKPNTVFSHEPEVQRWLHPWRDDDWATRAYWRMFPNFGLSTTRRGALLRRYHDWDVYEAIRLRWLRRLVTSIALGGLEGGPKFGLVRTASPSDAHGMLFPFAGLKEPEHLDEAIFEAEAQGYVWTASDRRVSDFLALCEARAPQPRELTPSQAHAELGTMLHAALGDAEQPWPAMPVNTSQLNF